MDDKGVVSFRLPPLEHEPRCGGMVGIRGRMVDGELLAEQIHQLAPAAEKLRERWGDWQSFNGRRGALKENLAIRAAAFKAVRDFWEGKGFLEVETPLLVEAPGLDVELHPFKTEFHGPGTVPCYLITSPEHHMKRLIGSGFGKIYQIARCFRNREHSPSHNPEFTMIEWYRAFASYEEIMEDTEELVAYVCSALLGTTRIEYQGMALELSPPWKRLSVSESFWSYAGIEIEACGDVEDFRRQARSRGYMSVSPDDSWEEIFHKIFIDEIEPALRRLGPVFLRDYPVRMASMAKTKGSHPGVAERVETYIAGLELSNGFTELNDPREQRLRFSIEQKNRRRKGYPEFPLDEAFLAMMEEGMPPAGGMALGADRMVMLIANAASIDEVICFPFGQ